MAQKKEYATKMQNVETCQFRITVHGCQRWALATTKVATLPRYSTKIVARYRYRYFNKKVIATLLHEKGSGATRHYCALGR